MTQQPNGVHHFAFMAADIKKQVAFFSEVVGCPLVAIFDMHGVPGALHAFMRLNDHCYVSVVQMPQVADIQVELGKTHAGSGALPSARGTLQHLAFNVDTEAELVGMRDRIRSHGVNVIGPIDHGMCRSIYFAGPDQMTLEVACGAPVDPDVWIDPAVLAKAGISAEEAARYAAPPAYVGPSPVPQPPYAEDKPHMAYPKDAYMQMLAMPDAAFSAGRAYEPPKAEPAAAG